MQPSKIKTTRGYAILKSALTAAQITHIQKELTVTPNVPLSFAGTVTPFKVWVESPTRYYLPHAWADTFFGPADADARPPGELLPSSLHFKGCLRQHQVEALDAFRAAGRSGIICLPCGYGKTFTGIAAATADPDPSQRRRFIIVVHKEFLADQWTSELKTLVPGIRIGRIQGERCDIGPEYDVAIAMIQTICSRAYPIGTFDSFGMVLFDEVHHLGAEHFSQALQRIQCKHMLGLTATPNRVDGLSKVFEWSLGRIVYQIARRPKDDSVGVRVMRYVCDDDAYADVPTNWKGETIRARLINQIAAYKPRTTALVEWIAPMLRDEVGRRLLILSDRREHLIDFATMFAAQGLTSIGYYVGGMKQVDLDTSATKQIILGTYAMASEGMNIPTLNTILLATPKSNIEQSVGRILRQKKEERVVAPRILDILDTAFMEANGQWAKRRKFYKSCGYSIKWSDDPDDTTESSASANEDAEDAKAAKTPLFVDDDADDATDAPVGNTNTEVNTLVNTLNSETSFLISEVPTIKSTTKKPKSSAKTYVKNKKATSPEKTPLFVED
jgi:superfamily II DNA or RNA helicase